MLTEADLNEEDRIRRVAARACRRYLDYARRHRLAGNAELSRYWAGQAAQARTRFADSVKYVRAYALYLPAAPLVKI